MLLILHILFFLNVKVSQDPGGLEPASPQQLVNVEGALDHSAIRLYFDFDTHILFINIRPQIENLADRRQLNSIVIQFNGASAGYFRAIFFSYF